MGKTLKICLAMGGGVSLGVFSGAALTEALKLLLLYGQDKNGEKYDTIVLDGMSGASAGAISLTILLKSLMNYKAMMQVYNKNSAIEINEDSLISELTEYFDEGFTMESIGVEKLESLKALQLSQKIQHQVWAKKLTSEELFQRKTERGFTPNPHDSFALLDRKYLEKLAKDYLLFLPKNKEENEESHILDNNRVLFACSITNLLPMEINSNNEENTTLLENALKSTGSQNHSELRVIDFIFKEDPKKPSDTRWLKFQEKDSTEKMHYNFKNKEAWSILASSALACGAFPFAFEPVFLKRYKEEYSNDTWPKAFDQIQEEIANDVTNKSFFNEKTNNTKKEIDYNSFNFPYIDGGTFNNEPIKEAFKIASFQDFGCANKDFDRLVLFVDPAVRQEEHKSFNINSYLSVNTDKINKKSSLKTEASKLFNNFTTTIGVLANQGSIKEEHRIKDAKENLQLRQELYKYINSNKKIYKTITVSLIKTAFEKIILNLNQGIFSVGTRDVIIYFENELNKNCLDNNECLVFTGRPLNERLEDIKEGIIKNTITTEIDVFTILNKNIIETEHKLINNLFAQTVFRIITDFSLSTVGKNNLAEYMAILPISNNLETIKLPGNELAAFAGFASLPSRQYSFDYGKLSTLISLSEGERGFRSSNPIINTNRLEILKKSITTKLKNIAFYDNEYKYSIDIQSLYKHIVLRIINIFTPKKGVKRFFVTKAPSFITAFAGSFFISPFRSLKNILLKKTKKLSNEVYYKKLIPITISIISENKLPKKIYVHRNNKTVKIKMFEHKQIENGEMVRYQYLFQLYYIEYVTGKDTKIGLSPIDKIKNSSVDKNIFPDKWREENNKELEKIELQTLELKRYKVRKLKTIKYEIPDIIKNINKKELSLFYSLKNINYHVNPMLEYNIDSKEVNNTWYFKENTKAFYLELLEEF